MQEPKTGKRWALCESKRGDETVVMLQMTKELAKRVGDAIYDSAAINDEELMVLGTEVEKFAEGVS